MSVEELLRDLAEALKEPEAERDLVGVLRSWAELATGATTAETRYHLVEDGGPQDLTKREALALTLAHRWGWVRSHDLASQLGLCAEAGRLLLAGLCRRGVLRKVGDKRGAYYVQA